MPTVVARLIFKQFFSVKRRPNTEDWIIVVVRGPVGLIKQRSHPHIRVECHWARH